MSLVSPDSLLHVAELPISSATSAQTAFPQPELLNLIASALHEQQELTAVETFSRWHENDHSDKTHRQAGFYRELLPATPLEPGEQLAFSVDLDACSGCKACVTACHSLNGLDDDESWRQVGLLLGTGTEQGYQQHVTSACHHCVDPGCLSGCPTNAYEKDPVTGIVRHLDDQCFGCQYCILACPYDVPQYRPTRGIVRKCDMCSQRLKRDEAPACVQACPHQAIRITKVRKDEALAIARSEQALPARVIVTAPRSTITVPTTQFVSQRQMPSRLQPGQQGELRPMHAHPPLSALLVLTQAGVGVTVFAASFAGPKLPLLLAAGVLTLLGLAIGGLHLGRPWLAYRVVLGIRHSWLSREAVVFGLFALLWSLAVAPALLGWWRGEPIPSLTNTSLIAAVIAGLGGVYCSAMVYIVTGRPLWNARFVGSYFLLSTIKLGAAWSLVTATAYPISDINEFAYTALLGALVAGICGLMVDAHYQHGACIGGELGPLFAQRARLLTGPLRRSSAVCGLCAAVGLLLLLSLPLFDTAAIFPLALLAAILLTVGDMFERHLFFVANVAPSMPRGGN